MLRREGAWIPRERRDVAGGCLAAIRVCAGAASLSQDPGGSGVSAQEPHLLGLWGSLMWQVEQSHSPCGQDKMEEEGLGQAPGPEYLPLGPTSLPSLHLPKHHSGDIPHPH